MLRRLKEINYPLNFVEEDKLELNKNNRLRDDNLKDIIKNDNEVKEAFISVLLDYASKYINEKIQMPEDSRDSTTEYINENNPVLGFLNNKCIITNNSKDFISKSDLYNHFKYNSSEKLDEVNFKRGMIFNGFDEKKSPCGNIRGFRGVKIKQETEDTD